MESAVEASAADNLATRCGSATDYRETGTCQTKGETTRLVSMAYDAATFEADSLPEEEPLHTQAKVVTTSKAMYGPGDGYGTYAELMGDEGRMVTVIAIENNYAHVEWATGTQSYRAWVSIHRLNFAVTFLHVRQYSW